MSTPDASQPQFSLSVRFRSRGDRPNKQPRPFSRY